MSFYADLHIHSKYSRATAKNLDLEHLWIWAQKKGLSVVGTGDCTHPGWLAEIAEKLVPAEQGLFVLKPELAQTLASEVSQTCKAPVRFLLTGEVATIYKKSGKTRKVHHVICLPDFKAAHALVAALGAIGNIRSDGRPILGLDSRDLLEIVLKAGEGACLIPAHVWTPWFSVLGSKSGFDSIEECYADLSEHIFALETGLSSDPAMNWRVGRLDRYRLVSNSDAHSPAKLGRECTVFDTSLSYNSIFNALKTGVGYQGTVEFFPEEGKYHFDGHRACKVRCEPRESRSQGGLCPVCGKALTLGVLYRVEELADRAEGQKPGTAAAYQCLVPLNEILSGIFGVGPNSKTVTNEYERLLAIFGPELEILADVPLTEMASKGFANLALAIERLRKGLVSRDPGFDGEFGKISVSCSGAASQEAGTK